MPVETLTREIFGNIGALPQAIFYALAILAGLIAAGLDPAANIIFNQSQVAEHALSKGRI